MATTQAQNKEVKQLIKQLSKQLGLKSRSEAYFSKYRDYFIYYVPTFGFPDNKFSFSVIAYIKPFVIDDVFWDVFDMKGNSKEPISLRAVGSFKVIGAPVVFSSEREQLEGLDIAGYILARWKKVHEEVLEIIDNLASFEDFLKNVKELDNRYMYSHDLMMMLLLIHNKHYKKAKEIAEELLSKKEMGRYQNKGKWINEYILDYCNERMT